MQERQEEAEEGQIASYLRRIIAEAAFVIAFIVHPLMKCAELDGNVALSISIERWVSRHVGINGFLDCNRSV